MIIRKYLYFVSIIFCSCLSFNAYGSVDQVVVEKGARQMYLISDGQIIKSYPIALGYNSIGQKQSRGDGKTPEGQYIISGRNANSSYHKALVISYPNFQDRSNALKKGVSVGSNIVIHGFPNLIPNFLFQYVHRYNWTLGAIAVTDSEIDEIWNLVQDGTPVTIKP